MAQVKGLRDILKEMRLNGSPKEWVLTGNLPERKEIFPQKRNQLGPWRVRRQKGPPQKEEIVFQGGATQQATETTTSKQEQQLKKKQKLWELSQENYKDVSLVGHNLRRYFPTFPLRAQQK